MTRKNYLLALIALIVLCISCKESVKDKVIKLPNGNEVEHSKLDAHIKQKMTEYDVPGLGIAIINGDSIAYEKVFGVSSLEQPEPLTNQTMFEAASLSKPLFAYFVMKQVDKGLIVLDTSLSSYVEYPDVEHDERHKRITARKVMSHTSGLPNWRNENDTLQFARDPGEKYGYSGEGFQYLARATASVNGVDRDGLFEVFKREVAIPLNANRLYYNWNDDVANHKPHGHRDGKVGSNGPSDWRMQEFGSAHNLHSDVNSYAKFISAMISGEGLSEKTHQEMLKQQIVIPEDDFEKAVLGTTHWSLGFGMQDTPNGWMYTHGGNNGYFTAFTLFYPEKEFGLVMFTNSEKIMFSNFINEITSFLETDLRMDMEKNNEY